MYEQVIHYYGAAAESRYAAMEQEHTLMPSLSELGDPTDIECHEMLASFAIFSWETSYLICRYTPDEYEVQKAELETEYTFQREAITEYKSNCEPSVEVDGYLFRLLSIEEYKEDIRYPHKIILIGCSDEAREIVYAVFDDFDLDYILSLEEFITENCGWRYIR